jgi:hypothetical protein
LVDPYGLEVASFTSASSGLTYTIRTTGVYTLLNEGYYYYPDVANITLTLSEQTVARHELAFNDQMTGSLAGWQSIAEYGFTLDKPVTTIVLDALDTTAANVSNLQWQLSGPNGVVFGWYTFTYEGYAIQSLPAGRYTLSFRNIQDAGADYKFRILNSNAGVVLQPGTSVNDRSDAGQTRVYRFNANAGDRYYFDGQNNYYSANEYNTWQLIEPFGRTVTYGDTSSDARDINLSSTGEYLLVVFPQTSYYSPANAARNVKFNLAPKSTTTAALTLNEQVTGSIAQPGQTVKYSFTLAAPTTLLVDTGSETVSGAMWSLSGPRGSEVSLRGFNETAPTVMTLPAGNDEYTVNRNDLSTETYNFRLLESGRLPVLNLNQATQMTLTADNYTRRGHGCGK